AADVARQYLRGAFGLAAPGPQYSQAAGPHWIEHFASLAPLEAVFAVAQKGEMTVLHPLEQRAGFAQLGGIELVAKGAQVLRRGAGGRAHARPIDAWQAPNPHCALPPRLPPPQRL